MVPGLLAVACLKHLNTRKNSRMNSYKVEDTDGVTYYVAAETVLEVLEFVEKYLSDCDLEDAVTVLEESVEEVDPMDVTGTDGDGNSVSMADEMKDGTSGIISCSDW